MTDMCKCGLHSASWCHEFGKERLVDCWERPEPDLAELIRKAMAQYPNVRARLAEAERDEAKALGMRDETTVVLPDAKPAANPFAMQVGGGHYTKCKIQPFQYSLANGLGPAEHTVVKYVTRWRDKGGLKDLEKAKHVIDLLIAFEMEKQKEAPENN